MIHRLVIGGLALVGAASSPHDEPANRQKASADELDLMGAFFGILPERYRSASSRTKRRLFREADAIRRRVEAPDEQFGATYSSWAEWWPEYVKTFTESTLFPVIEAGTSNLDIGESSVPETAQSEFPGVSQRDATEVRVGVFLRHLALGGFVWRFVEFEHPSLLRLPIRDDVLAELDFSDVWGVSRLAYTVASSYDTRPKGSYVPAQILISDHLLELTGEPEDGSVIPGVSLFCAFHFGLGLRDVVNRHYWLQARAR